MKGRLEENERDYVGWGKIDCVGKGEIVYTEYGEWWFGGQKGGAEE